MSEKPKQNKTKKESGASTSGEITLESKGDIGYLKESREKLQELKGFEPCYTDIVDYIIRCTHRIWEEKGVGVIYSHYKHNIPIWTSDGVTYGREIVVENTLKTLAAFPDCKLIGDEVIWSGNDEDGYHTSHRITWVAHNTGHSIYGPPTGKRIVRTGIANCLVKDNIIIEEWIARDELGLIQQLGFNRDDVIKNLMAGQKKDESQVHGTSIPERSVGQFVPDSMRDQKPEESDIEYFMKKSFHEIWNMRLLNKINDYYQENLICHTTCGRHLYGTSEYCAFVLSMLAAIPDAKLTVDHFYCMGNEKDGYKTMTRWSLKGTHKGPGIYGKPTGKPVYLMGISHNTVQDGIIKEEWTYFDEVAMLKQIYTPEISE
jgi:predicted ester cyclase